MSVITLKRLRNHDDGNATVMTGTFYEQPILNSPYEEPALHHALDEEGQPTDNPPIAGRRRSELITPVPKPRKRRKKPDPKQATLDWQYGDGKHFHYPSRKQDKHIRNYGKM